MSSCRNSSISNKKIINRETNTLGSIRLKSSLSKNMLPSNVLKEIRQSTNIIKNGPQSPGSIKDVVDKLNN